MNETKMPGDSPAATNLISLEDHRRGGRGGGGVTTELRQLPLTDVWNGKWFSLIWGMTTRYNFELNKWIVYQNGRWAIDDSGEADRRLLASIEAIPNASHTEALVAGKKPEELYAHYRASLAGKAIAAAEKRARSQCPCKSSEFDVNPMLLNVANGTIDLTTGELRIASAEDLLMKQAPVLFDEEAKCPEWRKAVDEWFAGDKVLVNYLRRVTALFLTGDVRERAFFMLYGSGRNGKGTYVSTMEALLGSDDYAFSVPVEFFLRTKNHQQPIDVHAARGKRLVVIGETDSGADFNTAKIKTWTSGGDTMSGKALFQNLSNYRPTHKLLLQTNHEPKFNDRSEGFADRLKKIPFLVKISDDNMKLGLKDYLRENELSGILNWALGPMKDEDPNQPVGLADWRVNQLATPEPVKHATREMLESQDEFRPFLEEACVLDASAELSRNAGYIGYRQWCDENRVRRPLGRNSFIAAMREHESFGFKENVSGSRKHRGWEGIRLGQSSPAASGLCELCPRKSVGDGRCAEHPRAEPKDLLDGM